MENGKRIQGKRQKVKGKIQDSEFKILSSEFTTSSILPFALI